MSLQGGFCAWLTGLPCSGKTTIARALAAALEARGITVTLLDGDAVRPILSAGLKFSREDRHINLMRIAFVAKEVVRHGGVAICATVSPYRADRAGIRATFDGLRFLEIHVDAPLSLCEARDVKGMYARARRGEILHFTGVDDPYEPPEHADIVCDTSEVSAEDCVQAILRHVDSLGISARKSCGAN